MKKQGVNGGKDTISVQNKELETASIMTVQEVAEYLRIGKDSVYKLVKRGEIPAAMILNKLRFERSTVDKYFRRKENNKT